MKTAPLSILERFSEEAGSFFSPCDPLSLLYFFLDALPVEKLVFF